MGRILAIDYGRKRCGIAVSDPLRIIANGLQTVAAHQLMDFLKGYIPQNGVDLLVVGMPRQNDGTPSESYTYIRPFVERLKKEIPTLDVEMFDERFTSKLAQQAMITGGVPKQKRQDKGLVDMVSATIILQGYMESLQYTSRSL